MAQSIQALKQTSHSNTGCHATYRNGDEPALCGKQGFLALMTPIPQLFDLAERERNLFTSCSVEMAKWYWAELHSSCFASPFQRDSIFSGKLKRMDCISRLMDEAIDCWLIMCHQGYDDSSKHEDSFSLWWSVPNLIQGHLLLLTADCPLLFFPSTFHSIRAGSSHDVSKAG